MVYYGNGLTLDRELQLEEELLRRKASRFSFKEYCTYVDPNYQCIATQNMRNVHDLLIHTLEDVAKWNLKRLRVSCPPRLWKSTLWWIMLPTRFIGRDPTKEFTLASYSAKLAMTFGKKARDIVQSKRYKNVFPKFQLAMDQNTKANRETTQRWWMYTVWVEGTLTGIWWNILYVDDPIKDMADAQSIVMQENIRERFDSVLSTRKQTEDSAIVVTMTRWHVYDLAWKLKEKENEWWEKYYDLTIKAIDDEWYPIIWPGKRWPDYFLRERETRSPKVREALFQQNPIMITWAIFRPGNERLFHESDFEKEWTTLRKSDIELWIFVDPAFSSSVKSDDVVVRCAWQHKITKDIYFFDMFAETQAPSIARQHMFTMAQKWELKWFNRPFFSIERSTLNKDQAKFYRDFLEEMTTRNQMFTVYEYRPKWEKHSRIRDYLEPFRSSNKLYYNIDIAKEYHKKIMDQYWQFPNLKKDDVIDCDAQAAIQFMSWIRNVAKWEKQEMVRDPITWLPIGKSVYTEQQESSKLNKSNENVVVYDPITWIPMRN